MRLFQVILFSLLTLTVEAQLNEKIVLVPIHSDHIAFDSGILKMLGYNHVSEDSAKIAIARIIQSQFTEVFKDHSLVNIEVEDAAFQIIDSVGFYKLFEGFRRELPEDLSQKRRRLLYRDYTRYKDLYHGLLLDSAGRRAMNIIKTQYQPKLIITINRIETIQTHTALHVDVFDSELQRVYAGKILMNDRISKTMYFDVYKHYIKTICTELFRSIINNEKL